MADLKILDTGFVNWDATTGQTQLATSLRAGYNGSSTAMAFTLNVSSLNIQANAKIENKPVVDSLTEVNTSTVSTTNKVISVETALIKSDANTEGFQYNKLTQLLRLERTSGIKIFYPSSATLNTKRTIIEAIGYQNINDGKFSTGSGSEQGGTVASTIPYIPGRVKNMRVNDTADGNFWKISFDFEMTG